MKINFLFEHGIFLRAYFFLKEQLYVNEDRQSLCNTLGLKLCDVNGPLLGELLNKCPHQTNVGY